MAGVPGSLAVDLDDAVVEFVQLETEARATERIRQDDVGAGVDVRLVESVDGLRVIEIEALRRVAGLEAGGHQLGAGGAVDQKHVAFCEQLGEHSRCGHRSEPYGWPRG